MSDARNTSQDPETSAESGDDALAKMTRERDELLDQLQRTRAEFLNYQKRSKAQADEERKYAISRVASDLVAALDDFERAADAARAANVPSIVNGLDIVHKQMLAMLAKHGVEPIHALGSAFDPNQHEALMQQPDADKPEGTVVAELGKGYKIHERVLRPAKVAVSIRPA
ncbi:MAG: nucleotide exchange factor GrpE [Isosphaeraceae bacterium]|nr:nucleotide exchange factor GrpE [Isosphaeraceae bacterium]